MAAAPVRPLVIKKRNMRSRRQLAVEQTSTRLLGPPYWGLSTAQLAQCRDEIGVLNSIILPILFESNR